MNQLALLTLGETIILPKMGFFDPTNPKHIKKFVAYEDREDFVERILPVTKQVNIVQELKMTYFNLAENHISDREICQELPNGFVFEDASIFWAHLSNMVDCQLDGRSGTLLNSVYRNNFYVRGINGEIFVVSISFNSAYNKWGLGTLLFNRYFNYAGFRIFSASSWGQK